MTGNSEIKTASIPKFLYGTAWKEEETEKLTLTALESGFRAIDTANQRRHYVESAVGSAVNKFIDKGSAVREDLFIQTKIYLLRRSGPQTSL